MCKSGFGGQLPPAIRILSHIEDPFNVSVSQRSRIAECFPFLVGKILSKKPPPHKLRVLLKNWSAPHKKIFKEAGLSEDYDIPWAFTRIREIFGKSVTAEKFKSF